MPQTFTPARVQMGRSKGPRRPSRHWISSTTIHPRMAAISGLFYRAGWPGDAGCALAPGCGPRLRAPSARVLPDQVAQVLNHAFLGGVGTRALLISVVNCFCRNFARKATPMSAAVSTVKLAPPPTTIHDPLSIGATRVAYASPRCPSIRVKTTPRFLPGFPRRDWHLGNSAIGSRRLSHLATPTQARRERGA